MMIINEKCLENGIELRRVHFFKSKLRDFSLEFKILLKSGVFTCFAQV